MQRQSPSSKLANKDEQLICQKQYSPSSSGEEAKKMMSLKLKTNAMPETYIHLIPTLTLLCFLILYLSSHHLSPNDLAQLNVPKTTLSNPQGELQGIIKGDIMAIRSLKNLEQKAAGRAKHRLLHRKFAPF